MRCEFVYSSFHVEVVVKFVISRIGNLQIEEKYHLFSVVPFEGELKSVYNFGIVNSIFHAGVDVMRDLIAWIENFHPEMRIHLVSVVPNEGVLVLMLV